MVYAISDIHGCYRSYKKMLKKIKFSDNDTLYVLGDVIDRGKDSFKTLLDIIERPNVFMIKGNHEVMAIDALKGLEPNSRSIYDPIETADNMDLWFYNGGQVSLMEFLSLRDDQIEKVWDYLLNLPLYIELTVNYKDYVLLHGGLGNFNADKKLSDYSTDEIVWSRPEATTEYYPDKTVVVGHTPTPLLGVCSQSNPKVYKSKSYFDIDCGCAYGGHLACLCLDNEEITYV